MKIQRVCIENFRGIEHLELDWTDGNGKALDLVVLGGPNGCGKTSVIEACLYALGGVHAFNGEKSAGVQLALGDMRYAEWTAGNSDSRKSIRNGSRDFLVRITVQRENDFATRSYEVNSLHSRSVMRGRLGELAGTQPYSIAYFSAWRTPMLPGPVTFRTQKKQANERNPQAKHLANLKQALVDSIGATIFRRLDIEGVVSKATLDDAAGLKTINREWSAFYPGDQGGTFHVEPDADNRWDVFYYKTNSTQGISIDTMSSGQIELFTFIGWLTIQEIQPTILIVDEPEQHLHPEWQRAFVHMLQRLLPKSQIILATHASEIFDSAYSYQRFWLYPVGDPRIPTMSEEDVVVGAVAE